jgi:hypothetical protein
MTWRDFDTELYILMFELHNYKVYFMLFLLFLSSERVGYFFGRLEPSEMRNGHKFLETNVGKCLRYVCNHIKK